MKFGIDIGHNCPFDTGAIGIKSEDQLTMEVGTKVIEKLKLLGSTVVNCTPNTASSLDDSLKQRVDAANSNKVDLFVSIHFNYGGGTGTEVYSYGLTGTGYTNGQNVLKEIVALGFPNRGVKDGSSLYVIKNTAAPAILIECAFVDSAADMNRYNGESMANAIVKGLTGKIPAPPTPTPPIVDEEVLKLQKALNRLKVGEINGQVLVEDGILGAKTISAVKKLQYAEGLIQDGIAGTTTWNAINIILSKPLLSINNQNSLAARYIQWRLSVAIDGIFGTVTKNAVINYQKQKGLVYDGIVGQNTWYALIG